VIHGSNVVRAAVRIVGALLLVLAAAPVRAAEAPPPDEFVKAEIDALADLLAGGAPNRLDAVRDRIRANADFDGFARESLGRTWATLSPREQRRFRESIQRLLESYYMSRPDSIFDRKKVSVEGAKTAGQRAEVALTVGRKDVADDVVIDGLSLLEDYRAQFRSFLRKHSVRELIDRLDSRAKARYEKRLRSP
jgi:phospholipid transport system substrate-binding protein